MLHPQRTLFVAVVIALAIVTPPVGAQETKQSPAESGQAEREEMYYRYLEFASYVKGGSIEPHWMADGSSFWYAKGAPENTVIRKVDPKANTKTPLFDTARLRKALTPLLGHEPPYQGLPFADFTFVDGERAVKFSVESKQFILGLDTHTITRAPVVSEEEKNRLVPQLSKSVLTGREDYKEELSPDGRWFVGVRDHNLWLRSTYDGRSVPLTTEGVKDYDWVPDYQPWAKWSPDGLKLAVKKVDIRKVAKIPIVHWLKPEEEVEWVPFSALGGPIPQTELFIVDILSKQQVRVDIGLEADQEIIIVGWSPDGSELFFLSRDRQLKKVDLMAVNSATGSTRLVLTETVNKFFQPNPWYWWTGVFTLLRDEKQFIWMSQRDGWNHLYLYDVDGRPIRRLTEGAFPVRRVVAADEKNGWVYFSAQDDKQRVYDTHLYRVSLEGKNFTRLTEAPGQHEIELSPLKEFFLDTHSSTARPPVVELRRADGTLLETLSKADIDALKELKWKAPEEFVVKAADGKTDLHGVLYKPYDFDPDKKYPVIESIYGCPQVSVIQNDFIPVWESHIAQALAQLGFITFTVDGRGTPGRGKIFQDVVYGNQGRNEIPDHVASLRQLAEKRPHMDLSRVGITGHSCGGYFTIRALLQAPDVYHVGVARAAPLGPQYSYFGEVLMGRPQNNKEAYEYASNQRLAGNLKGKLLLIHGTSDHNVPFSNTMKMVEALIRVGKPYDLIVLPEVDHNSAAGGPVANRSYAFEAVRRYFQEHLKPE